MCERTDVALKRLLEVFGDEASARGWLYFKVPALGFKRPIDVMREEGGVEKVLQVLGRIEHGIVQ